MAQNYTGFSFEVWVNTEAERAFLKAAHDAEQGEPADEDDMNSRFQIDLMGDRAVIYSEDDMGDIEAVAVMLQEFLGIHRPLGTIVAEWAMWCSKARPGEFGGGAVLITSTRTHWFNPRDEARAMQNTINRRADERP